MTASDHPWQSARDKFDDELFPKLQSIGKQIGADAANGNVSAKEVMDAYSLLHRSFDPMTALRLEKALEVYEACEDVSDVRSPISI